MALPQTNSYLVCEECQEITELKDAGVAIFRYKVNLGNVQEDAQTGDVNVTSGSAKDIFVVLNTKEGGSPPAGISDDEKNKLSCKRCQHITSHAQKLLQSVHEVKREDITAICDHCRDRQKIKDVRALCDEIVTKYFFGKSKRGREKLFRSWPAPIGESKSDTDLNRTMRHRLLETSETPKAGLAESTKYHSEDSIITSFPQFPEDAESMKNKYLFPEDARKKKSIDKPVTSAELISDVHEKKRQEEMRRKEGHEDREGVRRQRDVEDREFGAKGVGKGRSAEGVSKTDQRRGEDETKESRETNKQRDREEKEKPAKDKTSRAQKEAEDGRTTKVEKERGGQGKGEGEMGEGAKAKLQRPEASTKDKVAKEEPALKAKGPEQKEREPRSQIPARDKEKESKPAGPVKEKDKATKELPEPKAKGPGPKEKEPSKREAPDSKGKEMAAKAAEQDRAVKDGVKTKEEGDKSKKVEPLAKDQKVKGKEPPALKEKDVKPVDKAGKEVKSPKAQEDKATTDKKGKVKDTGGKPEKEKLAEPKDAAKPKKQEQIKVKEAKVVKGPPLKHGGKGSFIPTEKDIKTTVVGQPSKKDLPPTSLLQAHMKGADKIAAGGADDAKKKTDAEIRMNQVLMAAEKDTLQFAMSKPPSGKTADTNLPMIPDKYTILQLKAVSKSRLDLKKVKPSKFERKLLLSKLNRRHLGKLGSDLELDIESLLDEKRDRRHKVYKAIKNTKIVKNEPSIYIQHQTEPEAQLFTKVFDENKLLTLDNFKTASETKSSVSDVNDDSRDVIQYALSDRKFIDKGWTMLPTEKVLKKMHVYRMHLAQPEFDWFLRNKEKGHMTYDTGEKLAEIDGDGRGRLYYKNGNLALKYYNSEEMNAQQRIVIYSSGEPDDRGRSHPVTLLAMFDFGGNGIVFDHIGKIRLKYNQTEGVVLDRELGPVSHWKWHSLNDPPVLQQVMIDTHLAKKDPEILRLGLQEEDHKGRPEDHEEMLAIEFDNFAKEKAKKLSQTFQPYQIRMKALKINNQFSLKILNQASVNLVFRDGVNHVKLNLGMVLDHQEIVDTKTVEINEVEISLESYPGKTESLEKLQTEIDNAKRTEKVRSEREKKINRPVPTSSIDQLAAALSRPRPTLREYHLESKPFGVCPVASSPSTTPNEARPGARPGLYYDTRLI